MAADKERLDSQPTPRDTPKVITDLVVRHAVGFTGLGGQIDPAEQMRTTREVEKRWGDDLVAEVVSHDKTIYSVDEAVYDAGLAAEAERVERELRALRQDGTLDSSAQPE